MVIKTQSDKTILDLMLQSTGQINSLLSVLRANNISITDQLASGNLLKVPTSVLGGSDIAKYYESKNIQVATAVDLELEAIDNTTPEETTPIDCPDGLYWQIVEW